MLWLLCLLRHSGKGPWAALQPPGCSHSLKSVHCLLISQRHGQVPPCGSIAAVHQPVTRSPLHLPSAPKPSLSCIQRSPIESLAQDQTGGLQHKATMHSMRQVSAQCLQPKNIPPCFCAGLPGACAGPRRGEGQLRATGLQPAPSRLMAEGTGSRLLATERCCQQSPTVAFPGSARGGSPLTPCQPLPAFTVEEQRQRLSWARGGRVRPDMGCPGPLHTMEGWGSMALYGICPAPLPPQTMEGWGSMAVVVG